MVWSTIPHLQPGFITAKIESWRPHDNEWLTAEQMIAVLLVYDRLFLLGMYTQKNQLLRAGPPPFSNLLCTCTPKYMTPLIIEADLIDYPVHKLIGSILKTFNPMGVFSTHLWTGPKFGEAMGRCGSERLRAKQCATFGAWSKERQSGGRWVAPGSFGLVVTHIATKPATPSPPGGSYGGPIVFADSILLLKHVWLRLVN